MNLSVLGQFSARALDKFTPIHHWEEGLRSGPNMYFLGEKHDVGEKQLMGHLTAMCKSPIACF